MTFALCICTRNRVDDLRRCLQAIAEGERIPDQVIVSDDGDEGRTAENVVAEFRFARYQRGPRAGLGANRNACIASLTSEFACFIDDDVVIPGNFVAKAGVRCAQNKELPRPPLVTGVEIRHSSAGAFRVAPGNADFWGYQRLDPRGTYRSIVINACVFPARLFQEALFDPQLRYGSDEIDIARHATALGYTIEFDPDLQVDHFPSEVNRSEYAGLTDASRMYATAKDYWRYQRKPIKAALFCLLAPPKLALALVRRFGVKGLTGAAQATFRAGRYVLSAGRNGSSS